MKEIRKPITDEQVEKEIDKLKQSKAVKLAKQERRVKTKRRQYLYQLRWLERRGRELQAQGVTEEELELLEQEADSSEEDYNEYVRTAMGEQVNGDTMNEILAVLKAIYSWMSKGGMKEVMIDVLENHVSFMIEGREVARVVRKYA